MDVWSLILGVVIWAIWLSFIGSGIWNIWHKSERQDGTAAPAEPWTRFQWGVVGFGFAFIAFDTLNRLTAQNETDVYTGIAWDVGVIAVAAWGITAILATIIAVVRLNLFVRERLSERRRTLNR